MLRFVNLLLVPQFRKCFWSLKPRGPGSLRCSSASWERVWIQRTRAHRAAAPCSHSASSPPAAAPEGQNNTRVRRWDSPRMENSKQDILQNISFCLSQNKVIEMTWWITAYVYDSQQKWEKRDYYIWNMDIFIFIFMKTHGFATEGLYSPPEPCDAHFIMDAYTLFF